MALLLQHVFGKSLGLTSEKEIASYIEFGQTSFNREGRGILFPECFMRRSTKTVTKNVQGYQISIKAMV